MPYASTQDLRAMELFQRAGVFITWNGENVHHEVLHSACADGHRYQALKMTAHRICMHNGGGNSMFHSPSGNGDALRFAFNSPLSYFTPDDWGRLKTAEVFESLEIKDGVQQGRLLHHWPCAAAVARNISFIRSIFWLVAGKARIKQQIRGICVALDICVHVDNDDDRFFLVKKEAFLDLLDHCREDTYHDHFPGFEDLEPEIKWCAMHWQDYRARVSMLPVLEKSMFI